MKFTQDAQAPLSSAGKKIIQSVRTWMEENTDFREVRFLWSEAVTFAGGIPMRVPVECDGVGHNLILAKSNSRLQGGGKTIKIAF